MGDVDIEEPPNNPVNDDEGWETEDEMEAEAEQDDSELTFTKHTGKIRHMHTCAAASLRHELRVFLLSRPCVLRELGPGYKQPGGDRRRGRQGVCVEAERWRGSAGVHG